MKQVSAKLRRYGPLNDEPFIQMTMIHLEFKHFARRTYHESA